jgi:hypothetical protein
VPTVSVSPGGELVTIISPSSIVSSLSEISLDVASKASEALASSSGTAASAGHLVKGRCRE